MNGISIGLDRSVGRNYVVIAGFAAISTLAMAGAAQVCLAQGTSQKTFATAREATQALYLAVRNHDIPAMTAILGARKADICAGEAGEDKRECAQFAEKYREMRRLVREPDGTTVLYIGAENWPFPFPLVSTKGAWHFDSAAGLREIMFRRIGENETAAIQECHALVSPNAQAPEKSPMLMSGYYFRSLMPTGQAMPRGASADTGAAKLAFVAYPAEYRSS